LKLKLLIDTCQQLFSWKWKATLKDLLRCYCDKIMAVQSDFEPLNIFRWSPYLEVPLSSSRHRGGKKRTTAAFAYIFMATLDPTGFSRVLSWSSGRLKTDMIGLTSVSAWTRTRETLLAPWALYSEIWNRLFNKSAIRFLIKITQFIEQAYRNHLAYTAKISEWNIFLGRYLYKHKLLCSQQS